MSRTIRTFFEPDSETGDFLIGLDETESNHLLKVLRLNKGDLVEALDGQGGIYFTEISDIYFQPFRIHHCSPKNLRKKTT